MAEMLYTGIHRCEVGVYWLVGTTIAAVGLVWLTSNEASWQVALFDIVRLNMWAVLFSAPLLFLLLKLIRSFFLPFVVSDVMPFVKKQKSVFTKHISSINENKLQKKTLLVLLLLYILLLLKLCFVKVEITWILIL